MGYSSQAGQVGFKTQTAKGSYLPPAAASPNGGVYMKLRSGAMSPNRELLVADPEIGGGRDTVDAYLGPASWSGEYEFYARFESIGVLLAAALGSKTDGVKASGVVTHTYEPLDSATLPWLSVDETIGDNLETFNYTDAVVNTLHLESDANGYMTGTVGLIALTGEAGKTKSTTNMHWDNLPMVVGTNIAVTYNSVSFPAKSWSMDINNNFEDDDFRLGSLQLGDLVAKAREISFTFSIRHSDSNMFKQAVFGSTSATTITTGVAQKQQLEITCTSYEDIAGSTPSTKNELKFTVPKAAIEPFGFEPSGDDAIENDITMRAVRPDPATKIMTATLKNGVDVTA